MQIQEQAFRAYYESMTDSELLAIGEEPVFVHSRRTSPTDTELLKRHLDLPADRNHSQLGGSTRSLAIHAPGFWNPLGRVAAIPSTGGRDSRL